MSTPPSNPAPSSSNQAPDLDYAPPTRPAIPKLQLELPVLTTLTAAPILINVFLNLDLPPGQIAEAIWLGFGAVLPWRYAVTGRHWLWAGLLALFCTLCVLAWLTAGICHWCGITPFWL